MNPSIFNAFKNENLSPSLILIKRIGQTAILAAVVGIIITQIQQGEQGGTLLATIASWLIGVGFLVGIICFAVIGISSIERTKTNTATQAVRKSISKLFLYIYLPAFIITALLIVIFVLPRYL